MNRAELEKGNDAQEWKRSLDLAGKRVQWPSRERGGSPLSIWRKAEAPKGVRVGGGLFWVGLWPPVSSMCP